MKGRPIKRAAWILGAIGAVLLLAAGAGAMWWTHVTGEADAAAMQGLRWQATLGISPYVPGDGGLIPIGSQADLLGRYLSLMDAQTAAQDRLVPVSAQLSNIKVLDQRISLQGGYVEYKVTTRRTMRHGSALDTSVARSRVTVWVEPGRSRPFTVTAIGYDFDPHTSLAGPDSLSYLAQLMTPQSATPLGF